MSVELLQLLLQRIRAQGPLRFDEFVELALYSDPSGYYRSHVPGADSDYQTAATLTPWFGRLVCRRLEQLWRAMVRPAEFTVVEVGAGSADLAHAALGEAEGGFASALRWVFVEPIPEVAQLQQQRIAGSTVPVRWANDLAELDPVIGVVLANEVLDNFPFRLFEVTSSGPAEVFVDASGTTLVQALRPVPQDETPAAVAHLQPGDRFEVQPGLAGWVRSCARALAAGFVLVIDYGDLEPELWTRRPAGTMVTYRMGKLGIDPLIDAGSSDITCHVNFSDLRRQFTAAGFRAEPVRTQREWLGRLGLGDVVEDLRAGGRAARRAGRYTHELTVLAERSKVQTLGSGPLGDFLVFEAMKQ